MGSNVEYIPSIHTARRWWLWADGSDDGRRPPAAAFHLWAHKGDCLLTGPRYFDTY